MKEMFEASVDGQAFDMERWGQYFRPAGTSAPAGSAAGSGSHDSTPEASTAVKSATAPSVSQFDDEDDTPTASAPVQTKPAAGQKAEDILAMIRSRQNK
jgi:hypothetical protein